MRKYLRNVSQTVSGPLLAITANSNAMRAGHVANQNEQA
jgi:hypothetical protein